jgi:hypothetical protein
MNSSAFSREKDLKPGSIAAEIKVAERPSASSGVVLRFLAIGAPVAQLDRASGYEPEGREFESPRAHHLPFVTLRDGLQTFKPRALA